MDYALILEFLLIFITGIFFGSILRSNINDERIVKETCIAISKLLSNIEVKASGVKAQEFRKKCEREGLKKKDMEILKIIEKGIYFIYR